jgi:hypothetical protein
MAEEGKGEPQGSAKILRVVMTMVAQGSTYLVAGQNQDFIIDKIPELFHAFYLPSAFSEDEPGSPADIICNGPGIIAIPNQAFLSGIGMTIFKRRMSQVSGAAKQEVHLYFSNPLSLNINVAYKVYRVAGLV